MVLYARSDVVSVTVPVGHGGCGQTHTRPVIAGAPVKQFELICPPCENFLRADIARTGNKKTRTVNSDNGLKLDDRYLGLWGSSPNTIPESPDQEKEREWAEQKTVTENASTQTEAFGKIADALAGNTELIAKLAEIVAGQSAARMVMPAEPMVPGELPKVDPNADQRACLDCGLPIIRAEGQKGALAHRCVTCKATHLAQQKASRGRAA